MLCGHEKRSGKNLFSFQCSWQIKYFGQESIQLGLRFARNLSLKAALSLNSERWGGSVSWPLRSATSLIKFIGLLLVNATTVREASSETIEKVLSSSKWINNSIHWACWSGGLRTNHKKVVWRFYVWLIFYEWVGYVMVSLQNWA